MDKEAFFSISMMNPYFGKGLGDSVYAEDTEKHDRECRRQEPVKQSRHILYLVLDF